MNLPKSEFVCIVLFQVLIFFIFITVFFFTYTTQTEQFVLKNQLGFLVDQTITPYLKFMNEVDPNDGKSLLKEVNAIKVDTTGDSEITKSNNDIVIKTVIILSITVLIILGIIAALFLLSRKINSGFFTNFHLKPIIVESMIILLFVAITEFVFLTYFGSRFISIDVNKVKIALIDKIKSFII